MHPNLDDLLALRDGDGSAEVADHVEHCAVCSESVAELRATASALRALPPIGTNRDHWPELRRRIVGRRQTVRAIRVGAVAASLIAVAASVVLMRAPATAPAAGEVDARLAVNELTAASRGLEEVLRDPALRRQVLSPRRAAVIVDLEDRIAVVDVALADQSTDQGVEREVALWSHRVELLDALVTARTGALNEQGPGYAAIRYEGSQP
jgi:hypothetical protein